jgi:hypothetical protein
MLKVQQQKENGEIAGMMRKMSLATGWGKRKLSMNEKRW